MCCNRKIACCKPQRCLLIARVFTFVNEQTALLRPFFRSKNREKRVGFPKIRTFLGSETASAGSKKNREKRVGFPQMRTILGSETASAGAKNRVSAVAIAPFAHGEKGFHEMERLRGPLR